MYLSLPHHQVVHDVENGRCHEQRSRVTRHNVERKRPLPHGRAVKTATDREQQDIVYGEQYPEQQMLHVNGLFADIAQGEVFVGLHNENATPIE